MIVTVLKTRGPLIAKTWQADGTIKGFDDAKTFTPVQVDIDGVAGLYAMLGKIEPDPRRCIVRGQLATVPEKGAVIERNNDTIVDAPSNLFVVDCDVFDGTIEELVESLPDPFRDVSYVWQYSGSHGHPSKPGLRAHLYFWLDEPMTCEQAVAWSKQYAPGIDSRVHLQAQVNYTARPVMAVGITDPYPVRLGFTEGMLGDTVVIPHTMPVTDQPADAGKTKRSERKNLTDPSLKSGIVGAVCRAVSPYDLVDLFPNVWAKGKSKNRKRFTWLGGGGSIEGMRVADSDQHVLCSQETSPSGSRAVNVFDAIRLFVYGHLDADVDPDALQLNPSAAPAYRATIAWAAERAEVQAELGAPAQAVAEERKAEVAAEVIQAAPDMAIKLANVKRLIDECQDLRLLESELGRRVAASPDFTDAEREIIAVAMQRRATILSGTRLPIGKIRQWVQPAKIRGSLTMPDIGPDGTPRGTIGNLTALLSSLGISVRYNVISKRPELTGSALSFTTDNYATATVTHVASECAAIGMPHNFGVIKAFLLNIAEAHVFNPVLEWIESAPWDGTERLHALGETLTLKPGFKPEMRDMILRKWLIQAVAMAASPVPLMARGALIVQGPQYLGKTRWLKSLVPGHEELVSLGRTLDPNNKDSVRTAISHWIVEMGELDATFRKSDIAALKAFLSQDYDTLRVPYAVDDSSYQRRTAFFGTVNEEQFLHDATGNTRFWVIPVTGMDQSHGLDMQQIWAQALALWRAGETHYFTPTEMTAVNSSGDQFSVSGVLDDKVAARFAWNDPAAVWVWRTATQILANMDIQNPSQGDHSKVGKLIAKRSGKPSQTANGVRRICVPVPLSEVGGDGFSDIDAAAMLE